MDRPIMDRHRPPRARDQGPHGPRRPPRRQGQQAPRHGPPPRGPRPAQGPRRGDEAQETPGVERLQKVLAHAGVGSRRSCEEFILQGRVTVDGQTVRELGTKVDPAKSQIAVDGQRIRVERPVYFAVNKPKGYVSTNNDPSGRPRVVDLLPDLPERVYSVGRLDEMSVGLMILTNDGELANKLAHPRFGVEKVYRAVVAGNPEREVLEKLVEGVWLAEGKVRAKRVRAVGRQGEATILEIVLAEGKNREVRRMMAKLGHKVMSLTRVAVGPITMRGLKPGEWRPLSYQEVDLLRRAAAGLPVPPPKLGGPRRDSARPPRPPRPAGRPEGPAARRPPRPEGPAARRPPRPEPAAGPGPGPRPSRRPPAPTGRPQGPAPHGPRPGGGGGRRPPRPEAGPGPQARPPRVVEPPRRVIGLDLGPDAADGARRPAPRRRPKGIPPRRRPGGPRSRPGDAGDAGE